jgi:hypothetical protein
MQFFLKSIDCWNIVETGWTKPVDATLELITEKTAQLSNDKALHTLCQALSPSEFARISNSESTKEAWQILETTYEGTKLVKSAKLQMLIFRFAEIKMLEDETFGEFYSKMSDLRNSMVSLEKTVSDVKLIRKILISLLEYFRIKVTTIEESKDLEEMKIEELVGSLQTYELSMPPVKKLKTITLKASKKKVEVSSGDNFEDEEKVVAMLAKNFGTLMRNERFKKKFFEKIKKAPKESEPEEAVKKDPRGPRCFECSGFGHIRADCGNLKQGKGKAYNATLSDESEEEEALEQEKFLAFVAPHVEEEDSYSEHSDDGEELKEAYKTLYVEFEKLREACKQHIHDLNSLQNEKSSLLLKIQGLEEKLLETQLQLKRVTNEKLTHMLSIQKSLTDKTGLGYIAPPSDIPSTSNTVFVKPTVLEPPPTVEDKEKDKINGDIPATQKLSTIRRSPICHHCGLSGHVQPQCSLLKAQKSKCQERCAQTSKLQHKTSGSVSDSMASSSLLSFMESSTKASGSSISRSLASCTTASSSSASAAICSCQS